MKDEKGNVLTRQAAEHLAKYRVRCPTCEKVFCSSCKEDPYHIGFTCAELKVHREAVKCRFCGSVIEEVKGDGVFSNVCKSQDCIN